MARIPSARFSESRISSASRRAGNSSIAIPLIRQNERFRSTGNATFIPAPDNPDSTRAARFVSAALILNGQASPALDYSVSYQLVSNGRRYGDGPAGVDYQPASSTRSLYDGRIQTVDAQVHYRLGRFNLLSGGYEFENENYANDNTQQGVPAAASAVNVTQLSHSVFAQDQAQFFGDRLQISGAFRAQFFTLESPVFIPWRRLPIRGSRFRRLRLRIPVTARSHIFSAKRERSCARMSAAAIAHRRCLNGSEPASIRFTVIPFTAIRGCNPSIPSSFDAGFDQTFSRGA